MQRFEKYRKQNLPINNGTFRSYQEFLSLEESQWASRIKVCTNKQALVDIYNNFNNVKVKEWTKTRLRELKIKIGVFKISVIKISVFKISVFKI